MPKKSTKPAARAKTKREAQVEERLIQKAEEARVESVAEESVAEEPIGIEPICLNCKFYASGPTVFQGPHCLNPASPRYQQRMPESGTSIGFTPKEVAAPVRYIPTSRPAAEVNSDGLYDPAEDVSHTIFEEGK